MGWERRKECVEREELCWWREEWNRSRGGMGKTREECYPRREGWAERREELAIRREEWD